MDKKQIVNFLLQKKRGVYPLLIAMYSDVINSMTITMALELIQKDLENEAGQKVKLNYFSLAQTAAKFKKQARKNNFSQFRKRDFKDAHELPSNQPAPGTFKLD